MVPEKHPSMTTTLEHLKSHKMPTTTKVFGCLPIAQAMQAVVIDRIPIVQPQLASIIRDNAKTVMPCLKDPEPARPTNGKVIAAFESRPFTTCVFIVHNLAPTSHVWFVINQVRALSALPKVEDILPEETSAVESAMTLVAFAACFHDSPSIGGIRAFVSEQHPSVTTTLKHLKSHNTPSSAKVLGGLAITPTVQAVVVDRIPIVNP
jgi:hypothetical protein